MKKTFSMILVCLLFTTAIPGITSASSVVSEAQKYIGVPYASGGTSSSGFDCSGFTQKAFSDAGSSIPRTTGEQYNSGIPVDKGSLQAGDLVFFNTSGGGVSHAGIYIGSSNFIHSSSSQGVMISSINDPHYWGSRYIGARRLTGQVAAIPAETEKAAEAKVETKVEPVKAKPKEEPKQETKQETKPVVKTEPVIAKVEVAKEPVVEKVEKKVVAEVAATPDTSKEEKVVAVEIIEEAPEEVAIQADFEHLHPTATTKRFIYLATGESDLTPNIAI